MASLTPASALMRGKAGGGLRAGASRAIRRPLGRSYKPPPTQSSARLPFHLHLQQHQRQGLGPSSSAGGRSLAQWRRLASQRVEAVVRTTGEEDATELSSEPGKETTVLLEVSGMRCGGCSANVKKKLLEHPKVSKASVNLLTGTAAITVELVDGGSAESTAIEVAEAVESKGFKCALRTGEASTTAGGDQREEEESDWDDFRGLAFSAGFLALCCGHHLGHVFHAAGLHQLAGFFGGHTAAVGMGSGGFNLFGNRFVQSAAATAALLGPGREIITDGFKSLVNGVPNMNTLVGIGSGAALAIGLSQALGLPATVAWEDSSHLLEEPVMLLSVILLGRVLERRAKKRATRELRTLGSLVPQTSRLVFDQKGFARNEEDDAVKNMAAWNEFDTLTVETNDVRRGDMVKVLPGETIPVDGTIVAGKSAVDESLLTGESELVGKEAGKDVIAGTINYNGSLIVRSRSSGAESTVKAMKDFVETAQARDAPVQRLADSICGPFVYLILGLSTATFVFWQGFGYTFFKDFLVDYSYANMESLAWLSSSTSVALRYAVNVLVVACPCALGLATPTSVLVGTSLAAKQGVLIRGGDVLEELAKVDTIVVDKTGTVTKGWPSVSGVESIGGSLSKTELIHLAASLERNSSANHPIARGIMDAAEGGQGGGSVAVEDVEYEVGGGVKGRLDGKMTAVGSLAWVQNFVGTTSPSDFSAEEGSLDDQSRHATLVYVAVEGEGIVGRMSLVDAVREDAKDTLERLGKEVYMLSGDRQKTVSLVAESVGIESGKALGGKSPLQKAEFIAKLKQEGKRVAMIGDGVNDAPALVTADVGIAVESAADAAASAADLILLSSRGSPFVQVEEAMAISDVTFRKIKQNLGWALVYNVVALPLATGALLPLGLTLDPALAGAMMAGSSLTVLVNSLSIPYAFSGGRGAEDEKLGKRVEA
ncbi:heavy metal transporting ATPase [Chloropicon primus]|nr:heavy metal transporting ATPase [Chloropicon primus]